MIRRGVKIQLLVFVVVSALGIVYTGLNYVGLDKWYRPATSVRARFVESGGIFTNAEVTYRGVPIGRVGDLELKAHGVSVELLIDQGVQVPSAVRAVVENRSAVGEQYVDLQPSRSGPPYLSSGDEIPLSDTQIPLRVDEVLLNLDRFARSVDTAELAVVVDELGKAFTGLGPDLARLIEQGNALTESVTAALPQTIRLIEDGRTVLTTQQESSDELRRFSAGLAALSQQFRASDADLRATLDQGVLAARELDTLLRSVRPGLGVLLGNLVTVGQIQAARIPGLREIFVNYALAVTSGDVVAPGDGTAHFGLAYGEGGPCTVGYESTVRRTANDTTPRPPNLDTDCREPNDSPNDVRGARNAPTPDGRRGADPPGGPQTEVGTYDPFSGLLTAPGGDQFLLGSTGGQQRTLGRESWKSLLLTSLFG
ncbi:MAG TPA: MlaD family protein [Mycobacteriales bacterium]|nr:MlaD family protein [Mycobacteriales bacterium]